MRRKAICYLLMLTLLMVLALGCVRVPVEEPELGWLIVESPVTGRYYEVLIRNEGYSGFMAMSEVSRAEYEAYVLSESK